MNGEILDEIFLFRQQQMDAADGHNSWTQLMDAVIGHSECSR